MSNEIYFEISELKSYVKDFYNQFQVYAPRWVGLGDYVDNHVVTYTILGGSESTPDIPSYYDGYTNIAFGTSYPGDDKPQTGQQAILQNSVLAGQIRSAFNLVEHFCDLNFEEVH